MRTAIIAVVLLMISVLITSSIQSNIPECIQQKINSTAAISIWNSPTSIFKYLYRGQTTYYFKNRCCDRYDHLYSQSCKLMCAPSGGFAGRGDGRCADFFKTAVAQGEVWQDQRTY